MGIYFIYNWYLGKTFGSVFLNKPLLADSFNELTSNIIRHAYNYLRRIFTPLYLVIFILFYLLIKKNGLTKNALLGNFGFTFR